MVDTFKKVVEASYLTVDKSWSYRTILRYFYIQHERMREFLFPEEVYEHLMTIEGFTAYTEEELHQDLEQLVLWNNLIARQETGRARTIEEFKKKRFRYQCTPYTVEFERMMQGMEKSGESFGGSLEKKEFERLYEVMFHLEEMLQQTAFPAPDECAQVWTDLLTYFRSITKNTSDYIAHINSEEAEERMQTEAFLAFKDQFTTYLRDFIVELQQTALKIQTLIRAMNETKLASFLQEVVAHQQRAPRFEDIAIEEDGLLDAELGKWKNLSIWFLGSEESTSELELLEVRTNEQIRRITRVVQRLGERFHHFRSRKRDYLHLAEWFTELTDIDDAHRLSAIVFGVSHTKHLFNDQVPTEDIHTAVWEEVPMVHETNPRIRNFRERTKAGAIADQRAAKEQVRAAHLKQKQQERQMLEKYMDGNEIHLDQLPVIEPHVRKIFLNWINRAMMQQDRTVRTEQGDMVTVQLVPEKRMVLDAEDGRLEMPKVILQFQKEGMLS